MPPSMNAIWRYKKARVLKSGRHMKAGAFKSKRYVAWRRAADAEFLLHHKEWQAVIGHFRATIILNEKKRRSNADVDNRAKVVLDFLQRVGIIENDALCDGMTVEWGLAPEGVRIYLTPSLLPVTAPGRPEGQQRADGTYPAKVAA